MIETDGCTGFPDAIGKINFATCCTIHDDGGSDGALLDCVTTQAVQQEMGWLAPILAFAVFLMILFRPVYNLLQRLGVLPKTKGSKF
jgi:hypothetical protein